MSRSKEVVYDTGPAAHPIFWVPFSLIGDGGAASR
jgi:hypothetical protein